MRRVLAVVAGLLLLGSVASASLAAAPAPANRMVGNFDILNWDGSVAGHVVVNYTAASRVQWVPGTLDVTWGPDGPFPYQLPGAKQSHALLVNAWFGPGVPSSIRETGSMGSMCDFDGPGTGTCHDYMVVIQDRPGEGQFVGFGTPAWDDSTVWYTVGAGAFALSIVSPM